MESARARSGAYIDVYEYEIGVVSLVHLLHLHAAIFFYGYLIAGDAFSLDHKLEPGLHANPPGWRLDPGNFIGSGIRNIVSVVHVAARYGNHRNCASKGKEIQFFHFSNMSG